MAKEFEASKNALIVRLCGEIDQHVVAELKDKIDVEIEATLKKNLIIDFSEVSLMDSSGIGLILGRYKTISALGGIVTLCGLIPSVEKMIKLSGLEKIVGIYKNVSDADKALSKCN